MELRLLGPVEIEAGGQALALGVPQRRAVLAALAVDVGRIVTRETLIDRIWEDSPPARVDSAVYVHVAHLRQVLNQINAIEARVTPVRLHRRTGGYVLSVDVDEVDLHRFRRLTGAARASHAAADRVLLLREAVKLWRGPALAGLSGGWVSRVRETWAQERLDATVAWAYAELEVNNPGAVLGPLTDLVGEHPIAESVVAVLMRVLAATGRPGDALEQHAKIRRRLADELGAVPGPELQAVHQSVLHGELQPATAARGPVVPAQLPADVAAFTGRDDELASLDKFLGHAVAGTEPATVVISAVAGTAGVGKTALAVRWAQRARSRFPDGQLYVNLRGYDPDQPMSAADALAGFLVGLRVPGEEIPLDLDGRAARFRTETAGRRMLVVLDNAASAEQVRPLLPGTGPSAVVVTSRDRLAGLVALHGAYRIDLDLLPASEAVALLRRLIGARVDAEPDAAASLAEQCARLPLALRVAAELAAARPDIPLSTLVGELVDQQQRLRLLDAGGDPRAAVATVFSWSVRHLTAGTARVFPRLGLHPGADFDRQAAAALADITLPQADRALDELVRVHLVHATGSGRYELHDLLRAYSTSLSANGDRHAALTRLFDYYLAAAADALRTLHPAEAHRLPHTDPPDSYVPVAADPDTALSWLDTERSNLVAIAAHTATHGWPDHTIRLSAILFRYLDGGHHTDALAIHGHARDAARRTGNPAGQGCALLGLGGAHLQLNRYEPAVEHFQQALALFRRAGDPAGEGRALGNLGLAYQWLGFYDAAVEHHRLAIAQHRRVGDPVGEGRSRNNLGMVERRLGRYGAATDHHEQALFLFRRTGDRAGEAHALDCLGIVEQRVGRYREATEHHEEALALYRLLGNRSGEAHTLDNLGAAYLGLGRSDLAAGHYQRALVLFGEMGDWDGEAWARNGLGEAVHAAGNPAEALAHHTAALAVAVAESGAPDQQARAHAGLGRAYRTLSDPIRAGQHYEQALAIYTELGSPEAEDVRVQLVSCVWNS